MTNHLNIVLTRTGEAGTTRTAYDSNIAPLGQIAGALLREMGAEPTCPVPALPAGYRCDGCDCERAEGEG